jgi:hypothetical protein
MWAGSFLRRNFLIEKGLYFAHKEARKRKFSEKFSGLRGHKRHMKKLTPELNL